jgi:glycogen debranching enzyme
MTLEETTTVTARKGDGRRLPKAIPTIDDPYYILASSPLADDRNRVLKHDETFAVFDHYGDIKPIGLGEEGIYHEGTRYLSCLILQLGKDRPLLLSSTVKEDNDLLAVDLTNPDIRSGDQIIIPRGTLHIFRAKLLWQGICYERLRIRNYGSAPIQVGFVLHFEADFADIFEVRGTRRKERGRYLEPVVEHDAVTLAYEGLDRAVRRTRLEFCPQPTAVADSEVRFDVALPAQAETTISFTTSCEPNGKASPRLPYEQAVVAAGTVLRARKNQACTITTSNDQFNVWLRRASADLHMMITETPDGPYPYAGVPWYSTVFGRDGIITSLEYLWVDPEIARGVLCYLAANQAKEVIPEQDAEPGKILHETRKGEMAKLGEIPFGRYYGSVDATPLFVMLAGAYYERTGDRALIERLWPSIELALKWLNTYGDADGDGFVEYLKHSPQGLVQQGWKDSHDSVFHADGRLAQGPIALCEVQGYVYAARLSAAALVSALGNLQEAEILWRQAQALQSRFEEVFWCEDLSTYALALDGDKRPCRVRTSNAGHCLFSGIASPERARRVAQTLLEEDSFSGWGIRTVAASETRYNPMAYHNGSVWPHDNALIAHGLSRYGLQDYAAQVLRSLFDASQFVDLDRLPELFCGFIRRFGQGPTLYPVACSPQAWAAASVFLLVQACLGLNIQAPQGQIRLEHTLLPEFLQEIQINNLRVGSASVDLLFRSHGSDVAISVPRKEGNVDVIILK